MPKEPTHKLNLPSYFTYFCWKNQEKDEETVWKTWLTLSDADKESYKNQHDKLKKFSSSIRNLIKEKPVMDKCPQCEKTVSMENPEVACSMCSESGCASCTLIKRCRGRNAKCCENCLDYCGTCGSTSLLCSDCFFTCESCGESCCCFGNQKKVVESDFGTEVLCIDCYLSKEEEEDY